MTAPNITVPISADYTSAQQQAKAFLASLQRDVEYANASIKEAVTQDVLSSEQAAARALDAIKAKNLAIISEIQRAGDAGQLGGAGGRAYYTTLANNIKLLETPAADAAAAVEGVAVKSFDAEKALTAMRRPLTSLVDTAIGVPGPLGQIASRLGLMAGGGELVVGVLVGIAAIAGAYEVLTHETDLAQQKLEHGAEAIEHLRSAANSPVVFEVEVQGAITKIDQLLMSADKWRRLADTFAVRDKGLTGNFGTDAARAGGALLNAVTFGGSGRLLGGYFDNKANDATRQANDINAGLAVAPQQQLKEEAADLARVITERVADNAQRQRALEIIRQQKDEVTRLQATQGGTDAERRQRTHDIGEAAATAHSLEQAFDGVARKVKAADAAIAALAQRQTAARDGFQSLIAAEEPGTSDDDAAKLKAAVDKATAAKLSQGEIATLIDQFDAAQADKMANASRKLADKLRAELATTTGAILTPARQALQEFDRMIAEQRRQGVAVDPALVDAVRAQRTALADAEDNAKALKDQLDAIATSLSSGGGAIQAMGKLDTLLDQARHDVDATKAGTEQHAAAVERLKSVQQAVATLQSKTATETERAAAAAKLVESGTQRVAGDIAAAASAAAGLATAFLGANSEITKALVGVAGVAGGIEKISAAATKAGGLGKLLSTGAGVASIIPEVGGIIAGGGAIVSALSGLFHQGPSPDELAAQRAEVQALQQTISALHELSTKIGALDTANTSAVAQQAGIVAKSLVQSAVMDPKLTGTSLGANLIAQLGDVGLSFDDFKKAAAALGVTLTDAWHVTVEDLTAIAAAGDLVGNQTRELEASWAILGTSAKDQLQQFLAACEQIPVTLTNTTGGLAEAIAQLDLTSQAGRDAAATLVRNAYVAGTITAAVAEQFLKLLTGLADTGTAATQAASAIEVLDGTLSDIALVAGLAGHSMEDLYRSIDAATRAFPAFGDQIRDLFKGLDLSTTDGQSEFRTRVAAYAESLAKDGLTPDERGVLQWLGGLLGWVGDLGPVAASTATSVDGLTTATQALGATAQSVIQQILASASQAATDARRLGKDQTGQSQAEAESFESKIPGIGAVDVKDASSVARTLAVLRTVYGGLTADQTDLKDLFGGAIDFFSQFETKAPGASRAGAAGASTSTQIGTSASQLTEQTGVQIGAVLEGMYATERDQLTALTGIHATLAALTALPSPVVPTLPSWMLAGGGGTVVDRSVHIFIASLEVPFAAAGDPQGVGAGIGAGIQSTLTPDAIDASLGGSWRYGNLVAGDRTVRGKV